MVVRGRRGSRQLVPDLPGGPAQHDAAAAQARVPDLRQALPRGLPLPLVWQRALGAGGHEGVSVVQI